MPKGLKEFISKLAKKFNKLICDTSRIGIEVENDLSRLYGSVNLMLDVGANHGQTAVRFAKAFPGARIHSFEPVESNFRILEKIVKSYSNISTTNKGLSNSPGKVRIGLSENSGMHSLNPSMSSNQYETITLTTVDQYCHQNNISFIDILKIDVEGHELSVLEGAKEFLSQNRVAFIYTECTLSPDDYSPHTNFDDLRELLSIYGFHIFAFYHEGFNLKSGCALANALFVNKDQLPRVSDKRLKNIFYPD